MSGPEQKRAPGERWTRRRCLMAGASLVAACSEPPDRQPYAPRYGDSPPGSRLRRPVVFGVHPLHNPQRLFSTYGPIVDRLNAAIDGVRFVLEASRNYDEFDKKLYARHFDLALPNPYETINALKRGYRVFGKLGGDEQFRGIILLRRDSPVRQVRDLRGRVISFPAPTALAAAMLPQQFLHDHGLPLSAYTARYVGSQESSIMNVLLGDASAGSTWPPPWQMFQRSRPAEAAQLKVQWQTATLPNNSLVARDDFPPALLAEVKALLFGLHESAEGQALLAALPAAGFVPASEATYQPVRDFVARFSRTVRAVET